jgi:mono/diheme cytochrome c family protein
MRLAVALLLSTVAVIAAGCGVVGHIPNKEATGATGDKNAAIGKTLFKTTGTCGGCHTLADAGTQGTIGPNLDDAFKYSKMQGFDESTIRDVVRGWILYATGNPTGAIDPISTPPGQQTQGMPENLLKGEEARDVAIYVAKCSGNPHCGVVAAPVPSTTTTTSTG